MGVRLLQRELVIEPHARALELPLPVRPIILFYWFGLAGGWESVFFRGNNPHLSIYRKKPILETSPAWASIIPVLTGVAVTAGLSNTHARRISNHDTCTVLDTARVRSHTINLGTVQVRTVPHSYLQILSFGEEGHVNGIRCGLLKSGALLFFEFPPKTRLNGYSASVQYVGWGAFQP